KYYGAFGIKWFSQRYVDMNRSFGVFLAYVDGFIDDTFNMPAGIGMVVINRKRVAGFYMFPVNVLLLNGLSVALSDPFRRPVGGQNEERNIFVKCFGYGGSIIVG